MSYNIVIHELYDLSMLYQLSICTNVLPYYYLAQDKSYNIVIHELYDLSMLYQLSICTNVLPYYYFTATNE